MFIEEFSGFVGEFENFKKCYDEMVNKEMNKEMIEVEILDVKEVVIYIDSIEKIIQVDIE